MTRADAIEQYLISLVTFNELNCLLEANSHFRWSHTPETKLPPSQITSALRAAATTWIAKLLDRRNDSINVFEVWRCLVPGVAAQIDALEQKHQSTIQMLRQFRNKSGAHSDIHLKEHLEAHTNFDSNKEPIFQFLQDMFSLAKIIHQDVRSAFRSLILRYLAMPRLSTLMRQASVVY
jgi:hypothetical protein